MDEADKTTVGGIGDRYWDTICDDCKERFNKTKKWEYRVPGLLMRKLCESCKNKVLQQAYKEAHNGRRS